jgi:hypothetical protein
MHVTNDAFAMLLQGHAKLRYAVFVAAWIRDPVSRCYSDYYFFIVSPLAVSKHTRERSFSRPLNPFVRRAALFACAH